MLCVFVVYCLLELSVVWYLLRLRGDFVFFVNVYFSFFRCVVLRALLFVVYCCMPSVCVVCYSLWMFVALCSFFLFRTLSLFVVYCCCVLFTVVFCMLLRCLCGCLIVVTRRRFVVVVFCCC